LTLSDARSSHVVQHAEKSAALGVSNLAHPSFLLSNNNLFQTDGIQGDVNLSPLSIRCPHCRELGSFDVVRAKAVGFQKRGNIGTTPAAEIYSASVRICPNVKCFGLVFAIQRGGELVELVPPQLLDFNLENLPPLCQTTLKEAVACHGAGAYRASAMLVRRLLEEICELNGAEGNTLHTRLSELRKLIILPESLFEAMNEPKALGNDAAHVEAKAYDSIGREEAEDSIELAKEILKALYQLKGLVARFQARKSKP
jgi:hypothetical protein